MQSCVLPIYSNHAYNDQSKNIEKLVYVRRHQNDGGRCSIFFHKKRIGGKDVKKQHFQPLPDVNFAKNYFDELQTTGFSLESLVFTLDRSLDVFA